MVDDGIVIAGGGFAGFWAALLAAAEIDRIGQDIELTLVSRDDHLTLRPRLYEAAPERFRTPLRPIFNAIDIRFVHGSVDDIDSVGRGVVLAGYAGVLPYGRLVLATGCVMVPPPVPGIEHTFNVDTWDGAMRLERHLASLCTGSGEEGCGVLDAREAGAVRRRAGLR